MDKDPIMAILNSCSPCCGAGAGTIHLFAGAGDEQVHAPAPVLVKCTLSSNYREIHVIRSIYFTQFPLGWSAFLALMPPPPRP